MSTIFRSELMSLCQLYLQTDVTYSSIAELGELGVVQFRDLNPNVNSFQRKFVNEVRRCEEMERKLRFLEAELKKDRIVPREPQNNIAAPTPRESTELESTIDKLETNLKQINTNADSLIRDFSELTELKYNLVMAQSFVPDNAQSKSDLLNQMHENDPELGGMNAVTTMQTGTQLGFTSGVILREKMAAFEVMLWRVCRGNVFVRQTEIEELVADPFTGERVSKTVFVVFYQGEQLKNRVQKICEGFRAHIYPCPADAAERQDFSLRVMTRLEDLNVILRQTEDHRRAILIETAKSIRTWSIKVKKVKAIYHTMNMFNNDVAKKCFIAECWVPTAQLDIVRLALRKGAEISGNNAMSTILNEMETNEQPPTFNRLNKLTQGFQNLVDAYGVATYREINPMPFVVITFPFLFAVMFGDAGHGLIVALFAFWMVWKENILKNKWKNQEVLSIIFGGRYIILLMGIFSIYTGLIYNDFFSKSVNIFGSSWRVKFDDGFLNKTDSVTLEPNPVNYSRTTTYEKMYSGNPYPLGLDPIWQLASNKITFTNSVKMKFAIIIGIIQMGFGVCLSLGNHIYFKHYYAIYLEFLPQLIFLVSIFYYLIILIFYKWTHFQGEDAGTAPSLLIHLINMMLMSYPTITGTPESSKTFYSAQKPLQMGLLACAVVCIPWMLLGKPIYKMIQKNKAHSHQIITVTNPLVTNEIELEQRSQHNEKKAVLQSNAQDGKSVKTVDDEHLHVQLNKMEVDMSEVWVEQGIHTIEYFLGCISHTASYLRLWALSLAHAQLSEVLWHMVLHIGLSASGVFVGGVMMYLVFMPWSSLTVFILLLMEGLSAFLHALRLHWVEFQSKFYKGEGYPFVPFSFQVILDEVPIEN